MGEEEEREAGRQGRHELGAAGGTQCLQEGPERAQDPGDPESLRMAVFKDGGGGGISSRTALKQELTTLGRILHALGLPGAGAALTQSHPSGTAAMLDERS